MKVSLVVVIGCHRKRGELIEHGILMKHKSGVWIIGRKRSDKYAKEIGGCDDAPSIVNFKKRRFETC